ncbi:MAG: FAD-dependent oxidoreductase [Acidiferrobacterales bacterium]|nr:FAD-dependent oxidoreductase [Acidiferrobacterales bacterium]
MQHVIVGAGPAGVIAAETLRKRSRDDSIIIVGNESYPAYSRMAIPYLLAGDVEENGTYLRHNDNHFDRLGIEIRQNSVTSINPGEKTVGLAQGPDLSYDRLLLATGSSAIRPPISGMDSARVHNCWTLDDAHRMLGDVQAGDRVVLLGAGFIGCIVLQALVSMKLDLTVVELADHMLARMMDHEGGQMIQQWCEGKGVAVRTGSKAVAVTEQSNQLEIELADGSTIAADHIVCAAGVRPNIQMLEGSGIKVDAGILVDDQLQTNVADIFAAGDVAQGPDRSTGDLQVHAIQPTASEHGRAAAFQMSGDHSPYGGSLSMNVLNTLGLITSSFGLWDGVDGGDRTSVCDAATNRYLRLEFQDDLLVGALAIGLTQHVGVLRGLIQTKVRLGHWKELLMSDPSLIMSAYLDRMQGTRT